MTFDQIMVALGQRLETMPGCPPIAWENADAPGVPPYLEFRMSPAEAVTPALDGSGHTINSGICLVTVVTERGKFATAANALAQSIAARFPKSLRLTAGSGNVVISRASSPASGFTDGTYWRVPVRIYYTTEG